MASHHEFLKTFNQLSITNKTEDFSIKVSDKSLFMWLLISLWSNIRHLQKRNYKSLHSDYYITRYFECHTIAQLVMICRLSNSNYNGCDQRSNLSDEIIL